MHDVHPAAGDGRCLDTGRDGTGFGSGGAGLHEREVTAPARHRRGVQHRRVLRMHQHQPANAGDNPHRGTHFAHSERGEFRHTGILQEAFDAEHPGGEQLG